MSRFSFDDYYEEEFPNQAQLWWANLDRAVNGKRGQQALGDLRDILLAMPDKQLISGRLANEEGHVCTLGAFVLARECAAGGSREDVLRRLADKIPDDDDDGWGWDASATAGRDAGLTYSLAWRLAYLNDEDFGRLKPEGRYLSVLDWIERRIGLRG
jgi:hypothetical protein